MSDISKLYRYKPETIDIITVYTCTLNPAGPIVGFEVKVPSSRYTLLVHSSEMMKYIKDKGSVKKLAIFNSANRDGLVLDTRSFRSKSKNFSLSKGDHVVDINHLQKLTWAGIIDYTNKVQTTFTSLC